MSEPDTAFAQTTPASQPTSATESGEPRGHADAPFSAGDRIGERYVVRGLLGRGGMGAVYRATDEKLGEDIALKVVRAGVLVRDEVRLAQKVTHPNVCRTYDLEEADGHQLVKMELVAGETLATRVGRGPLAIVEAVRIARAIADGLAAAHAQGIVHRDLKPGNVMLAGERVVLMDFGIAAPIEQHFSSVAGTIGYMAPEQIANTEIDERADLYALGCLLYEMLAGAPVFGAGKPLEIAARHASLPPPDVRAARREVPRWLARAVAGLLAKEREARPAGLAKLRAGALGARRIALAAGGAALAIGAVALVVGRSDARTCDGFDARVAGVWNPATKLQIHERFLATRMAFAERSYTALERALDGFANAWVTASADSCRATRVRGEQPEDVLALRAQCYDQVFGELSALSTALLDSDGGAVMRGDRIAAPLFNQLASCRNVRALREETQPPPELVDRIRALQARLSTVRAELGAGSYLTAVAAASRLVEDARAVSWPPIEADALDAHATALALMGNFDDSERIQREAVWQGMRAGRDDDVARDAFQVAATIAEQTGKPDEAQVWIDLGNAALARIGATADPSYALEANLTSGVVAGDRGDIASAIAFHEQALTEAQLLYTQDHLLLAVVEANLAASLTKAGACIKAVPHYEHALALREASVGPDHPDISLFLSNLGDCYLHLGEFAKARAALDRALAIRERFYGARSPMLAAPLDNLAEVLAAQGQYDQALALADRAKRITAFVPGTSHASYHTVATTCAEILVDLGRYAEAHAAFDEIIALERRAHSSVLALTLTSRADLALHEQHGAEAAAFAQQAVAALEAVGGKQHPGLWRPLTMLGRAQAAQGDPVAARAALERALAIAAKGQVSEHDLAPTRAALASLLR